MNLKDYQISQKPFDQLGHGLYFWENNYDRAFEWATQKKYRGGIKEPAVVGAVLSLGHCCDFLDKRFIETLAFYFSYMKPYYAGLGKQLPQNEDLKHDLFKDKILRNLDCAAIEYMHGEILDQVKLDIAEKGYSKLKSIRLHPGCIHRRWSRLRRRRPVRKNPYPDLHPQSQLHPGLLHAPGRNRFHEMA